MASKKCLQMLLLLIINFIALSKSQQEFVFPWPGPTVVPEEPMSAVKIPDSISVEFSNNGTVRTIRIQENVRVSLDCSRVVETLVQDSSIALQTIMVMWSRRRYDINNDVINTVPEDIVDDATFDILGDNMEILNISNANFPITAAEQAESGEYTCRACGTMFAIGGTPPPEECLESTSEVIISGNPPTIDRNPLPVPPISDGFLQNHIGNDICIPTPLETGISGYDILCVQNPDVLVPANPTPVVTWALNGVIFTTGSTSGPHDFLDVDSSARMQAISLQNFDTNPQSAFEGVYMCNRTNIFGEDSETTLVGFAESVTTSAVITSRGDDGCDRFDLPSITSTFCVAIGETVTISCSATSSYTIGGPGGQSMDQDLAISNIADADGGTYNCSTGDPCFDMDAVTINVITTGVPEIVEGPETIVNGSSITYNIGQNICIRGGDPQEIVILCGHDINNEILPTPNAVWDVPDRLEGGSPESAALTFSMSPLRLLGDDTQLTIDNDGEPIDIVDDLVGNYTCVLSNSAASDTSTTTINISPNLDLGGGTFDIDPPEGQVAIGNSTCITRRGDPTATTTRISCIAFEGVFDTTWSRNGVRLPETSSILINQGPGVYTCIKSNPCGTISASTTILAPPTIPSAGTPPVDADDAVFEVGQFVCANPMLGGNVQINCPLPTLADPLLTTVMWTKEDDPSFSFTGNNLSLPRSDADSAGNYTCTIFSGPDGACGMTSSTSTVAIQSSLTTGSGFVPGTPNSFGNQLTIGANTCFPPEGETLRIRCETTPTTMITWTLDGASVTGDEFIDVVSTGTYTCSAADGCGETLSASSVISLPETATITATIAGITGNGCDRFPSIPASAEVCPAVGEDVTVQCTASGDSYTISIGGNDVSTNETLTISPFSDADAGTYTCTGASNQCGTGTDTIEIVTPGIPPSITPPITDPDVPPVFMNVSIGEDVCLPIGQSVNINCVASTGSPPITYAWTMDSSTDIISTLNTLTVNQFGTYNCVATNSIGSDTASSTVFEDIELVLAVSSSSVPTRCADLVAAPANTDQCFFTDDSVTLSCFSRQTMRPGIIQPGGDVGTKMIRELTETDTMFTCSSSNECGNDSTSLVLLVQEPARIDRITPIPPSSDTERNIGAGRPDEPVEIMENVTVRLYCPFTGIDEPSTRWVRVNNDRTTTDVVEMLPNVALVNEDNNIILVIMSFTEELEGTYRCVTDNNAGNDGGNVVLEFDAPERGEWSTTQWSECDPDCHRGTRMRMVTCRGVDTRFPFPDNRCDEEKPLTMERCVDRGPCFLDPVWVPQAWSSCSVECDGGYRVRDVICQIPATRVTVADSECQGLNQPRVFEYCNLNACCTVDLYPAYCRLLAYSSYCKYPTDMLREICCCTCP